MTVDDERGEIVRCLRPVLAAHGGVRAAFLFGSHATGRARAGSDVDVAIVPSRELGLREDLDLEVALERACGRGVDLVRLDKASLLVGREVARDGVVVYEAGPHEAARARARATSAWLDLGPSFERAAALFLKRLAERAMRS